MYKNSKVCVCFVDYEKAFDRIDWVKLLDILGNIEVEYRDRRLLNMYTGQSAYVRVNDGFSEAIQIGRCVRQGCSLSPLLYSIYVEAMMKATAQNVQEGMSVRGAILSLSRCADDKAVVASIVEDGCNI